MKRYLPILVIFTLFTIMLVGCTNGNSNGNISVYTRDTSSGTREAFFEAIGFFDASTDDGALVSDALIVESNGDMINKIRNDQNGIGYISLSSLASSNLKGLTFDGVEATEANVLNGTYALKRPFNYIVTSNSQTSADQLAHAFNAYIKTSEAKVIIASQGGIVEISSSDLSWDDIKDDYPIVNEDNSNVTVVFGGSTSVESIARELSAAFSILAGNFTPEHNHTGSGAAYTSTQGSGKDGNEALHVGFASREFRSNEEGIQGTFGMLSWDAVVAVVNSSNELNNITPEKLVQIYSGEITKWDLLLEDE